LHRHSQQDATAIVGSLRHRVILAWGFDARFSIDCQVLAENSVQAWQVHFLIDVVQAIVIANKERSIGTCAQASAELGSRDSSGMTLRICTR
jgi:hypothetical protein